MVPGCSSIVWMMFTVIVLVSVTSIDASACDVCKISTLLFFMSVSLVLLVLLRRCFMLGGPGNNELDTALIVFALFWLSSCTDSNSS